MTKSSNTSKKRVTGRIYVCIGLFLGVILLIIGLHSFNNQQKTIPLSQAINDIKAGRVQEIDVENSQLTVHEGDKVYFSYKKPNDSIYQTFKDAQVPLTNTNVVVKDTSGMANWLGIVSPILPLLFSILFFILPATTSIATVYYLRRLVKLSERR